MDAEKFKRNLSALGVVANETIDSFIHINNADFNYGANQYHEYIIRACIFSKPFEVFNLQFREDCVLKFVNCHFLKEAQVTFVNVSCQIVNFQECVFDEMLYLNKLKSSTISISNCEIQKFNFLYNEVNSLNISNMGSQVIKSIDFNSEKTNYFSVKSKTTIDEVKLGDGEIIDVYSPIKNLLIQGDTYKDLVVGGEIYGNTNSLERLVVSRVEVVGFITVQNANIKFIELDSIKTQNGTLILNELEIDEFIMEDCQIKNVQFNIVGFKRKCEIIRSNLDGIKLFNVKWLKDRTLTPNFKQLKVPFFQRFKARKMYFEGESFTNDDLIAMRYQQDSYRQLKSASFANYNTIDGLGFYKNEMRLYWKEIRINGGENFWDTSLIFINRWSSNFGQNWFLPLLWMFLSALILYSSLLNWNYFGNDWSGGKEFGQFWVLFNPVHKTPEYINTGAGLFTEFFMRVVIGYFIYHFIKASRKFGRV